jgi:hypothetical protein
MAGRVEILFCEILFSVVELFEVTITSLGYIARDDRTGKKYADSHLTQFLARFIPPHGSPPTQSA